ncbi:hypothetical protein QQS21_006686 [Conoideocrella luteorostrata]|uniref:USP domain-containing protein n=1 Tax=Conoideocrella luteorostrata TaxID=1105319 RepID=A0AAJ0G008_9HYPO|nr:hypothetical protein QQS21_006686 [Conoideocrella luteorostrata]
MDNQMNQPSTPNPTTAARVSPNEHDSAPSPDPPSTRPNPFDDSDLLARKRRRTSGSVSPPPPSSAHDKSPPRNMAIAIPIDTNTTAVDRQDHIKGMMATESSEVFPRPQTPTNSAQSSSTPLSSSKVTLNLRKTTDPAPISESTSPTTLHEASPVTKDTIVIPEDSNMGLRNDEHPKSNVETPQLSDSASPPVELIALSENEAAESDDEMAFSVQEQAVGIIGSDLLPYDPIFQFPYTEPDEDPTAPLQRLITYLSTHTPIESKIIADVRVWIEDYLTFARTAENPEFVKLPELRDNIIDAYSSYVCLTARMVALDLMAVRGMQSTSGQDDQQCPEVFSDKYLQQLHDALSADACLTSARSKVAHPSEWPHNDIAAYLLVKLQSTPGGNINNLSQLASLLINLVPKFPKLMDGIAPIAQIIADCLREAARTVSSDAGGDRVGQARTKLEFGNTIWDRIFACLELVIEKQVTQLSADTATVLLQALTEMLKWVLRGDHRQAVDRVQQHMHKYPDLPIAYMFEAIAWRWRFDILERLIRSSQMQLRVMAVSKLCADLVSIWRSSAETTDEDSSKFLEHLGNHLLQTRLIDYVFGPNCHPEIIVESANILGFLIVSKLYGQEHIDRLWQGLTLCQDPRVAEALARMITSITNLLDYDGLLRWCEKFKTLPLHGFSPAMRALWDNIMEGMILRCQSEQQAPSSHPYDLCLRLLREASVCTPGSHIADPDLQQAAMQKLRDFLSYGPNSEGRKALYLNCIDDISRKSSTTLGSLWCLSMAIRGAVPREIQILTDRHDLARLVVEELAHAVHAGQQAGAFAVLSGGSNIPRRDMVANIIQFQPTAVSHELGTKLLDILVGPESPCAEDRKAGWFVIISAMRKTSLKNSFVQTCFSKYLPALPAECFSDGMLEFVRERVLHLAGENDDFALDDPESLSHSGIEQLWRIILEAQDSILVSQAISTLAIDLYLESNAIRSYPIPRCKSVHVSLVSRCLSQMKQAAKRMSNSGDGVATDDDEVMLIIATDVELDRQKLIFRRSLQLLRFFLEKHQAHTQFAVADLRPFMSSDVGQINGIAAELKYQAFDGDKQTDIMHLHVGLQNTVSFLLARLRKETGFDNYRLYFRGQQLLPTERQISHTLSDLQIHDDLILVKREEHNSDMAAHVRPGSSQLEIEILSHFQDLWEYLSMEETLAEEIYDFLVQLPADGQFTQIFESKTTSHRDIFLKGQPFKTLYAVHAIRDHIQAARDHTFRVSTDTLVDSEILNSYKQVLRKVLRLVVDAIADSEVLDEVPLELQLRIAGSLLQVFVKLVNETLKLSPPIDLEDEMLPSANRLVKILALVEGNSGDRSLALIDRTCAAILRVGTMNPEFWNTTMSDTNFLELTINFLLKDPRILVRQTIVELIEDAVEGIHERRQAISDGEHVVIGRQECQPMFASLCGAVIDALPTCLDYPSQSEEYFKALLYLVEPRHMASASGVDVEGLAFVTLELLLRHTPIEVMHNYLCRDIREEAYIKRQAIDRTDVVDPIAAGLTSVLYTCLHLDESLTTSSKIDGDIASHILWRHLFPRRRQGSVPRVVLNTATRIKLFDIVFQFARCNFKSFSHILDSLRGLVPFYVEEPDDPYLYDLPYQFDRSKVVRAPCGYVGLRNLSNTCYLNSLFTQLFMNVRFRSFILSVPLRDPEDSQQLLLQTQKLFGYMQESYQRFVDPSSVITSIKTYDDTQIDIHSQMDVDEFYNLLFDRWEGQLLDHEDRKRLRSFFGGQLVQQVKSKECEHISERLEPFSAIQCDIKGKFTLQESLQAYVDGEVMEGENKYKCSTCDRHVDAIKRACLKDVPDNLIFHLKRFDFNLRTMQRSKINDYFSFPQSLDVAPYTVDYLSAEGDTSPSDLFELVGILVHSGTAESGHYYSYIRERAEFGQPTWVEFNDENVIPWDPSFIEASTFGGPDRQSILETNGILYDRTYSAYMLFYQRASSLYTEPTSNLATSSVPETPPEIPALMREHILSENKIFLRRHCLFDSSYTNFVQKCFGHAISLGESQSASSSQMENEIDISTDLDEPSHHVHNMAMELALSHFDQVVTRAKDTPFFSTFSTLLQDAIAKCHGCAFEFHKYFSIRHPAFRALIQRNPDVDCRVFAGRALILAIEKIRSGLPHLYHTPSPLATFIGVRSRGSDDELGNPNVSTSVVQGTLDIFNHLWKFFHIHIRSWDEYFGTVLAFAKLGEVEVGCLLTENYLLKVLHIINADPSFELPANYQRMVTNLMRRFNSKPASFTAILELIDYFLSQLEPVLSPEVIVEEAKDRRGMSMPFPWTSDEIQSVHQHPERQAASFFVEKLMDLDQSSETTGRILGRLIETGEELDVRVFNTLRKAIQGETCAKSMDSSILAAGHYVKSTTSTERAEALIRHVCNQARSLQHSEGSAFVNFIYMVLHSRGPSGEVAYQRRSFAIQAIPTWAPYLLVYNDEPTRNGAELLIEETLFPPAGLSPLDEQDDDAAHGRGSFPAVIRQLGIKCLLYLQDVHVKRGAQLERNAAGNILRVVNKCQHFYETTDGTNSYEIDSVEFAVIQGEIGSPLQRLLVDELDNDGSGWEGSCGSSELTDTNMGIIVETTNNAAD